MKIVSVHLLCVPMLRKLPGEPRGRDTAREIGVNVMALRGGEGFVKRHRD